MDGSTTAALAVTEQNAGTLMRQATDVAGVCKEIVTRTAQTIQGRKYVKVEGWQSIAVAYGCVASSRGVEKVDGGIRAIGEVRRMSDGVLIASAEGFVGEDETTWYGGKDKYGKEQPARPEYARRAMAQTRAISRACRSAFAFVVTMIDGSLSTTPAEEMDGLDLPASRQTVTAPPASRPAAQKPTQAAQAPRGASNATFPGYGSMKGRLLSEGTERDLAWYEKNCRQNIADPSKARWVEKEQATLAAILAEYERRAGRSTSNGGDVPNDEEPPPHTDSDAF